MHEELMELYDLKVFRADFVDIPAIPLTEARQIKSLRKEPMKKEAGIAALQEFAAKLEGNEELHADFQTILESLDDGKPVPNETGISAEAQAVIDGLTEQLTALSERITAVEVKPPAETQEETEEAAEAPEFTEEEVAAMADTVEELTALADENVLDEEGLQALEELSTTLSEVGAPAAAAVA
jgi:hypothetical protein